MALLRRQARAAARVQPPASAGAQRAADRSGLFDERFLGTLEHLHMVSRKVFTGALRAERRTRKVGSGIEFADHRTYARGDDFRYIDWNLYGRLDRLLLRLFEEEEDLYIYILVDVSDSMAIGTPPKMHYAMQVGAALTYVGLANLDRVAIIPFADRLLGRMPPARGKNRIFTVFDFLRTCTIGGKTELAECMKTFASQNKRRGLVVVISDFYDPDGFEAGLNTLRYAKFEPFMLQVYDLKEASPDLHGDLTLVDCETGDAREVTVSRAVLEAYKQEHERYCQSLETYASKRALPFFRTHTAVPFDDLVLRIFRSGGFLR
ncbi:MAG: DUF58 domain-containing protein [Kofleriaceae bacterium]|jgi:uncharacterized protein (DUF58 family)|nr:DUF58 domain-containing protein [Kofleriaceae bacterium]MBP6837119.1 DUF58 domain-containing protein [Kofleriaceae bacterium]MBP9207189.1 DUF58 domain-containing protein [Kofleriaceae bacterium]